MYHFRSVLLFFTFFLVELQVQIHATLTFKLEAERKRQGMSISNHWRFYIPRITASKRKAFERLIKWKFSDKKKKAELTGAFITQI